jgi:hypothetical protein
MIVGMLGHGTFIRINLIRQERLILDAAIDRIIFYSTKGSHKGLKQEQVPLNASTAINEH